MENKCLETSLSSRYVLIYVCNKEHVYLRFEITDNENIARKQHQMKNLITNIMGSKQGKPKMRQINCNVASVCFEIFTSDAVYLQSFNYSLFIHLWYFKADFSIYSNLIDTSISFTGQSVQKNGIQHLRKSRNFDM